MQTKKDFIAMAKVLKTYKPDKNSERYSNFYMKKMEIWVGIVEDVIKLYQESNPKFNKYTFIRACGM